MTPKEKAKELYDKFYMAIPNDEMGLNDEASRQCALIAVDEILNTIVHKDQDERLAYELLGNKFYWEDVKQEIENL
tara:strand:+ start:146 stop:373 length:228 start_codon:yes stop_codon:yes gene_type:complete